MSLAAGTKAAGTATGAGAALGLALGLRAFSGASGLGNSGKSSALENSIFKAATCKTVCQTRLARACPYSEDYCLYHHPQLGKFAPLSTMDR